ncbi:MAG: TPM domain-containing protein, partial [Ramlibacter sp.]
LADFEKKKGTQIVVLMVPTTQPEDIASYANRVANNWKIGRKDVGDGVLLIVAKDDRKVRIEVAKTLEGAIPDLAAKQVIDTAITPNFRNGEYGAGLLAAADQLIARINGEALPAPEIVRSTGNSISADQFSGALDQLGLLFMVAVFFGSGILRRVLGTKLGALATGAGAGALALALTGTFIVAIVIAVAVVFVSFLVGAFAMSGPGSRAGNGYGGGGGGGGWSSGSSSSSSDSFSSGGGGDFGGGGASGDW